MAKAQKKKISSRPACAEGLDDREFLFVSEYIVDLNAKQAVLRCGWTEDENSAAVIGSRMRSRPHVARAIDKALTENAASIRVMIMDKLAKIADGDIAMFGGIRNRRFVLRSWKDMPSDLTKLVKKVLTRVDGSVSIELHDPMRAVEILGKVGVVGLTRENVLVQGSADLADLIARSMKPKGEEESST